MTGSSRVQPLPGHFQAHSRSVSDRVKDKRDPSGQTPALAGNNTRSHSKLLLGVFDKLFWRFLIGPRVVDGVVQVRHIDVAIVGPKMSTKNADGVVDVVKLSVGETLGVILGPAPITVRMIDHFWVSAPVAARRQCHT